MKALAFATLACLACSKPDAPKSAPAPAAPDPAVTTNSTQKSHNQPMSNDANQPGGTGVDDDGVLLRSKPDPNEPPPDPKLVADDDANLLFYAGALAGDPALQRRVWQQLGLVDSTGATTPKMTDFLRAHTEWTKTKANLAVTVGTADKARAYLATHLK